MKKYRKDEKGRHFFMIGNYTFHYWRIKFSDTKAKRKNSYTVGRARYSDDDSKRGFVIHIQFKNRIYRFIVSQKFKLEEEWES